MERTINGSLLNFNCLPSPDYTFPPTQLTFYKRTVDGKDIPLTGTTILENFSIEDQSNLIAGTLVVLLAEPAKAQLDEKAHTDLVDKLFRAVCSDPEGNVETSTVNEWLLYESCFQAVQLKSRMVKLQLALVQMLGVVEMCNGQILLGLLHLKNWECHWSHWLLHLRNQPMALTAHPSQQFGRNLLQSALLSV